MIDKVEYSDFNRFLVSAGYVLIGLALLLPYFYLRENFDLQLEATKIRELTPIAQQIVSEKQHFALLVMRAIPWLSALFIILGLFTLSIGMNKWIKRQKIEDVRQSEELSKLQAERRTIDLENAAAELKVQKVSEDEVIKNNEKELEKTYPLITPDEKKSLAQTYFVVEQLLAEKFRAEFSSRYNILTNYRINDSFFDIILSPSKRDFKGLDLTKDVIVEIKYSTKPITGKYVLETLEQTAELLKNYSRPITHPIVIFVMGNSAGFEKQEVLDHVINTWSQKTLSKWNLIFLDIKQLGEVILKEKINI
jgi:hypothetical protein